ncbi:MAG: glycosyltransferase [Lachnospiraceae bacterium]|nr:glycosyltransferase [Lachnospiraceae bacterium]
MKSSILFVMNTMGQAGAETALVSMLQKIDPREYDIDLYVMLGQGEMFDRVPRYVKVINRLYTNHSVLSAKGHIGLAARTLHRAFRNGAIFGWLPYAHKNYWAMRRAGRVQPEKLLWKLLADGARRLPQEYDLAVSFIEGASTYYVANHVKAKHKIAYVHVDYGMAGYTAELDRGAYDSIDEIYAVSDEVRNAFLQVHPECLAKMRVFHNILDRKSILKMAMKDSGFDDDYQGFRILTVGRLNVQKAYEIAIQALAIVRSHGHEARWYAMGEGVMREDLERKIAQNGLKDSFILMGKRSNPYPYYWECDLYVHATRFEGKSIAVQEAQILGCPIIVSDVNGNREQVSHGMDGLICDLNPRAVAEAIEFMIENPEARARMGEAACHKKLEHDQELEDLLKKLKGQEDDEEGSIDHYPGLQRRREYKGRA